MFNFQKKKKSGAKKGKKKFVPFGKKKPSAEMQANAVEEMAEGEKAC